MERARTLCAARLTIVTRIRHRPGSVLQMVPAPFDLIRAIMGRLARR